MKKFILTFVLCLLTSGQVFAQNYMEDMKFLTVTTMVRYGQQLYDRGDFNQALAVFNRVLVFDSHQAQALEYIKEMGRVPASAAAPVANAQVAQPSVPDQNIIVIKKSDKQLVNTVDASDSESLRLAIEAQKRLIEKLRAQITQMKENLASSSAV